MHSILDIRDKLNLEGISTTNDEIQFFYIYFHIHPAMR